MKLSSLVFSVWAIAMLASPLSFSADKKKLVYCEPVASLADRSTGCSDNEIVFGEAAVACLEKFEHEADALGSALTRTLVGAKKSSKEPGKSQEKTMEGSEENYIETKTKLAALIAMGQIAVKDVESYKLNLHPPEDVENAEQMGFTREKFLASIPCYEDNRKLLSDVASDLRSKIKDLQKAKDVAGEMAEKLKAVKKNVGQMNSLNAPVSSGKASEGPKVKKGKSSKGASDITGTGKKSVKLPK